MAPADQIAALAAQTVIAAIAGVPAYAVPLALLAASVYLVSEVLIRFHPDRDQREAWIAGAMGLPRGEVVAIGCGTQLWRDARDYLEDPGSCLSPPTGSPALRGTYLVRTHTGTVLLCFHNWDRVHVLQDHDEPGSIKVLEMAETAQACALEARIFDVNPDRDIKVRVRLLAGVFRHFGAVDIHPKAHVVHKNLPDLDPRVKWPDMEGNLAEHLTMGDFERDAGRLQAAPRRPDDDTWQRVTHWLRGQPSRQASRPRLVRRFLLGIGAAAVLATTGSTGLFGIVVAWH